MQRNSHYRIFSHPFFPRYFSAYNYAYGLNGNRIIDSRTALEFTYNLLNLPCEVRDSQDNMKMRYTYLSDGTKVSALDAAGDGLLYRGNFVYEKDGQNISLESIAWDEGRIRNKLFQALLHDDEPIDATDTLAVLDSLPGLPWHPKEPFFPGLLAEEGHWVEADTTELVLGPAIDREPLYQDQWFVRDHLGNVRSVIDLTRSAAMPADSVILEQNDYLPYGTKSSTSSLSTDSAFRYRYAGKEEQRFGAFDSQLLDFGARYYDPWSCQWTAVDAMAEKTLSQSCYNYCINNPLSYCDPYGRDTVYVLDQVNRPLDNGVAGTSYTGTVILIQNGVVSGEYRGSSYPNSVSSSDNRPASNTVSEGAHSYNNKYGHTPQSTGITERGLNVDDSCNGERTTNGLDPQGNSVVMNHVNVHSGTSDKGGPRSRGSRGCITIHPEDATSFFKNFTWTPQTSGVTGTSSGTLFIYRNLIDPAYCYPNQ